MSAPAAPWAGGPPCLPPPASLAAVVRQGWRWLLVAVGLALAWQALRDVRWAEVAALWAGLGPGAILIVMTASTCMLPLMTVRWWLLLRILGSPVGLLSLITYRSAANAIGYLTPGPQFGGEPLLVYLLHCRQGVAVTDAAASVALDRLLELAAGFTVLLLCLLALAALPGSLPGLGDLRPLLLATLAVFTVFAAILAALLLGQRPLSRLLGLLQFGQGRQLGLLAEGVARGEALVQNSYQRQRSALLAANLCALGHWLGVFAEFWLIMFLLGVPLPLLQLAAVVVAARLAFLTPLPGGLGALEAALPWVTEALGLGRAIGIGLCLVIRLRDLVFGLVGLGLGMNYLTCRGKKSKLDHNGL